MTIHSLPPPPPVEMDRWTDGWASASLTPLLFLLLQQLTRRRRRRRKKNAGPAAGPLPPSFLDPISRTRTFGARVFVSLWHPVMRLRLQQYRCARVRPGGARTGDGRAGLRTRKRKEEEEPVGDGFAKIWLKIRPPPPLKKRPVSDLELRMVGPFLSYTFFFDEFFYACVTL